MTEDLVAWLREQVAEDRRRAERAAQFWDTHERTMKAGAAAGGKAVHSVDAHVFTWPPDRVLVECDAKRQLIEAHAELGHAPCDAHDASLASIPCEVLELLALPYAGRPGYREDWRP